MIVCLDTNTVVQALAQHHPFHPILDAWVAGHLTWAVSTPILLEYEEVLTRLSGPARWRKLARLMDLAELTPSMLTPALMGDRGLARVQTPAQLRAGEPVPQ